MSGRWKNALRDVARRTYLATTIALEERGHLGTADRLDRIASRGDLVAVELPNGGRVKMRRREDRDQVAAQIAREGYNSFETPLPAVFLQLAAAATGQVLDVGANTGYYSLLAASVSAGLVVAFEPNPTVRPLLSANLGLNNAGRRVAVEAKAVGGESGVLPLYVPPPTARLVETSASLSRDFKDEIEHVVPVEVITLDDYWNGVGRPRVALVKIDVEGFQRQVLDGAHVILDTETPMLTVEVLPKDDAAGIERIRSDHGYVDIRLRPHEAVIAAVVGFDAAAWNHLLVPQHQVADVIPLLERTGLTIRTENVKT